MHILGGKKVLFCSSGFIQLPIQSSAVKKRSSNIFYTLLQLLKYNTNQNMDPQKTTHSSSLWGVFYEDFRESWSRYNGTTLNVSIASGNGLITKKVTSHYLDKQWPNQVYCWIWVIIEHTYELKFHSDVFVRFSLTLTHRIFEKHFRKLKLWFSNKISLKYAPQGLIDNKPTFVQMIGWHRMGKKPWLSQPMMTLFTEGNMCHSASISLSHHLFG